MQPLVSAVTMTSQGCNLYGVVRDPRCAATRGVLMVAAGGYRVGPHRMFLQFARDWAAAGIPVMQFDYQGQGDSEGPGAFNVNSLMHDIRSAIDCFRSAVPGIERVVLWGLCEGAVNSLLYARNDRRVDGLVLVNPEIDNPSSSLRNPSQPTEPNASQLWRPWRLIGRTARRHMRVPNILSSIPGSNRPDPPGSIERFVGRLSAFNGRSLVILSEGDRLAIEFQKNVMATRAWEHLAQKARVAVLKLPTAEHIFTRKEFRDHVSTGTAEWVRSLREPSGLFRVRARLCRPRRKDPLAVDSSEPAHRTPSPHLD